MTASIQCHSALWAAGLAAWLPFCAFLLIMIFLRHKPRIAAGVSIGAVSVSLLGTLMVLVMLWTSPTPLKFTAQWLTSADLVVPIGFFLDPVSMLMAVIVASIAFLIQIYSLGYMAGDPGFSRYYAFMSLFAWAMINLSISANLLQLYIFWELVGVASYLLIGFWYEKFSASEAGKKAFVMTRVGDVSLLLGILLVFNQVGSLDIASLNTIEGGLPAGMSHGMMALAVLLIFGGIVGKSAQFPLLTWLPDAMEGPTPVSALLHSATMVAAGVFLFARLFPFFNHSPGAMTVCLLIGTISMLLASTMAMVARDIKQVWAYSTISQLGYMIMGLAAGGYVAGVFHLTTHAGFKALLFLCSGVLIHHFETNDMFEIGQHGGRRLKTPVICMVIAAAALSGLPPLSGFFSKEMILGVLAKHSSPIWLWAGLLGAFLTAYYSFRLIFTILFPQNTDQPTGDNHAPGAGHHAGGSDRVMAVPLIVLAVITVGLGFAQGALSQFLTRGIAEGGSGHGHHGWLLYTALIIAAAGIVLAWLEFGRRSARQVGFIEKFPVLHELFVNRWYLDRFYRIMLDVVVYKSLSQSFSRNDNQVIDGALHALARGAVSLGRTFSILNGTIIQFRLMVIFVVVIFLAFYFFF